jgi:hypothetical protein
MAPIADVLSLVASPPHDGMLTQVNSVLSRALSASPLIDEVPAGPDSGGDVDPEMAVEIVDVANLTEIVDTQARNTRSVGLREY